MFRNNSLTKCQRFNSHGFAWIAVVLFFVVLVLSQAALADEKPAVKRGFVHGLHVGGTYPVGLLNNHQDSNIHFRMNAGYAFNNRLSLMAFIGFSQFTEDVESTDLNYYWFNASLNLKVTLITTPNGVSYFFQGGPGIYIPKSNPAIPLTTTFGFNVGIGAEVPISTPFHVEWAWYYHYVNISKPKEPQYSFLAVHLGVIYIW